MQAQTATTPSEAATGSKTLADLLPLAVEKHGDLPAQRYKDQDKGEWVDVSYRELATIAKEVSLGLQALGIERGDKVGILSNTRPEWTYSDFAILGAAAPWCRSTRRTLPRSATTCSTTRRPAR